MNKFIKGEILELDYNDQRHLAEFIEISKRIDKENIECYEFFVYTDYGVQILAIPININFNYSEPSKRTINKYKRKMKKLIEGYQSLGKALEKLGKINQDLHT